MIKKIDKLTPDQEALIPIIRDEWIRFCLGGDSSIDKEKAKDGVLWQYAMVKKDAPKFIAFADGPFAAQLIAMCFPDALKSINIKKINMASVRASVRDSVWASVRAPVWASVGDSVRDSVWASVRASVGASVRASVGASVWASVRDSVWASVRASVGDSVRDSVKKYETPWNGCSDDSGWLSWFDFFNRLGIKNGDGEKYLEWVKSGVWDVLWFEDLAVVTCRPSLVKKDETGRLYCSDGPAVSWPSGENYYFWHGTRVSEKLIMRPSEITKEDISNEKNSEVSRAIAEKLGWDEYMKRANTFLVDKWFDSDKMLHYELWDFKKRFELTPKLLKMESPEVKDGTRPYYIEPVDPGLKTCAAARAWQFMKTDGQWPTVEECNKDSRLTFHVEA